MRRVVVTGGGGYLGRHVVAALEKLGNEVLIVDPSAKSGYDNARVIDVDIFDGNEDIFERLKNPDAVIHLAWRDGFKHDAESHVEGIPLHARFTDNLMRAGLKQFVGMGSMHEIGYHEGPIDESTVPNPRSRYGVAKNTLRQLSQIAAEQHGTTFQWIRGFYITGDDMHSQSVFRKILEAEDRGETSFPFTSGKNKYDFIDVSDLGYQIACVANQSDVTGIINCCSGRPVSLAQKVEEFIKQNKLKITLDYGAFADRPYDSPAVWGDSTKIEAVLATNQVES